MALDTKPGFWTNRSNYLWIALVIAVIAFLVFGAPKVFAVEPMYGSTFSNPSRTSGEVTIQLGNRNGNLDVRGQRRFRDTDCDLDQRGRHYGRDRLEGFHSKYCNRDKQGYFYGHQQRFTPSRWDRDGDGVPNSRDNYPNNPRRD